MSASDQPISVAIVGAGIGGITLAIALSKHNPSLALTIFESRPEFSEIGAGVGASFVLRRTIRNYAL